MRTTSGGKMDENIIQINKFCITIVINQGKQIVDLHTLIITKKKRTRMN